MSNLHSNPCVNYAASPAQPNPTQRRAQMEPRPSQRARSNQNSYTHGHPSPGGGWGTIELRRQFGVRKGELEIGPNFGPLAVYPGPLGAFCEQFTHKSMCKLCSQPSASPASGGPKGTLDRRTREVSPREGRHDHYSIKRIHRYK